MWHVGGRRQFLQDFWTGNRKDDLKDRGRNERKILQQVIWESRDWINLAEGKEKRQAVVHNV
jgi:hypothetical protein